MDIRIQEVFELPTSLAPTFDFVVSPEAMRLFTGFGPIPGIREVHFQHGGVQEPGSRATIVNTDGSTHTEEILEHVRPGLHVIGMSGFAPPFSALIRRAQETWRFADSRLGTRLERTFVFTPRSAAAWLVAAPLLHLVFRQAMRRNHEALARWASGAAR